MYVENYAACKFQTQTYDNDEEQYHLPTPLIQLNMIPINSRIMKNMKNSITVPGVSVDVSLTNKLMISVNYSSFPHIPDYNIVPGNYDHEIKHC